MNGPRTNRGFTLLEVLLATSLFAVLITAVVTLYAQALRLRDRTTEAAVQAGLDLRALDVLRRDLRAGVTGEGRIIGRLLGSTDAVSGEPAGYLSFTTATGRFDDDEVGEDIQVVEYFVESGLPTPDNPEPAGTLVRTIDRILVTSDPAVDLPTRPVLDGVSAMEVGFFDGQQWLDNWDSTAITDAVPTAVRVRLRREAGTDESTPRPPLEMVVAWTMNPWSAASGSDAASGGEQP